MAATIQINRLTGVGPTLSDITAANTRANAEDVHSVAGVTNPIQVPATPGTNYSYWVNTQLNAVSSPSSLINNIRWFMNLAPSAGTTIIGNSATPYTQATGTPGVSGDQLTVGAYSGLVGAPVDMTTFTSSVPLSVPGSISNPTTGAFGDLVVYQLTVDETANPGITNTLAMTWQYDEV